MNIKSCIGIDLSMIHTGLAYCDSNGKIITGIIMTKKINNRFERFNYILQQVLVFIETHPKGPIFIEGYAYAGKGMVFNIGELGGIVKHSLYLLGYDVTEMAPKDLKKFVSGNGNADKPLMIRSVLKKWKYRTSDDNVADAIGLAKYGLQLNAK